MADRTVRPARDDEVGDFVRVQRTAMLYPPPTDEVVEARHESFDLARLLVAVDGGEVVGTTRCFATRLTVPGGAVPAAAVSSVGVLPTHRRRGHLSGLMRAQLAATAERGETLAMLVSAEWPIYGRYGYGVATEACLVELDTLAAEFREPPTGSVALEPPKAFRDALGDVYARATARAPGHMTWGDWFLDVTAGLGEAHDGYDDERRKARRVVWRDDDGTPQGVASYTVKDSWVANRPRGTLTVDLMAAATDEAERELYRYLAGVDWIATAAVQLRPTDDPLPFRLVDGRAAVLKDRFDHLWLRLVDVPAALAARSYATEGTLVLDVVDDLGFGAGRFALEAGSGGASCRPTDRAADLTVPVGALGAAYLGGQPWSRLAAAGWVDEHAPGAVARATTLFSSPRAPYCATPF